MAVALAIRQVLTSRHDPVGVQPFGTSLRGLILLAAMAIRFLAAPWRPRPRRID